ncbi:MAG TPA: MerR family transcriptional regulator [Intrasporangium sp.]|nr:MerR family transcriptional regulator [Intrasporangium sp.]
MYTIKRAAEEVGISPATLRAWERRYGIVSPSRSEGGYRLYGDDDVRALTLMARLVADGWTPSLAAQEVAHRLERAKPEALSGGPASRGAGAPAVPQVAPVAPGAFTRALTDAAATLDASALAAVLDEMFALASFESVVDRQLLPAMEALGDAWAAGRISVAGEHFVSNAVLRRLAAAYEAAGSFATGPRVLVGLPPGGRHELGLLAFAVAARRRGLAVDYLGADLPVADWASAVVERDPAAVVLAIPTPDDAAPVDAVVTAVRDARPDLLVAVGGREQDRAPEGTVRLGHDIGAAAGELVTALTAATGPARTSSGGPQ